MGKFKATHESKYGSYEIGVGYDGAWRTDIYIARDTGKRFVERRMCAGHGDVSAPHEAGYDSRCSCCYLHIDHTCDQHARSVASLGDLLLTWSRQ